jgi:spermidine synthase
VVGAVATGFVLIPALGVWHSQLLAVGINVGIGVLAIAVDRRLSRGFAATELAPQPTAEAPRAAALDADAPVLDPAVRLGAYLAFLGTAVGGMCALALEVMWTRAVSISVGTTTYSFTVMLSAFLVGIWLGSWLHAVFPLRRIPAHLQLGVTMVIIGLASFVASYGIPRLPELVVQLNFELYDHARSIRPATTLFGGFAIMLVPCVFMGIAFPLCGQARASLGQGFGRSAGDTLGWNTLGSIVGSLAAGFVLIPYLGLQRGMLLAAAIYVAYGCVVIGAPLWLRPAPQRWASLALTTGAVALALAVPALVAAWDVRALGAFQNNQMAHYRGRAGEVNVRDQLRNAVVLFYEEGRASTISVVDMTLGQALLVNGKAVASDSHEDIQLQFLLGHIPLLAHPQPKTALVIGMGTGFTLGSVTAHGSLDEVTQVEIEPAVLAAQPFYAPVNGDPLSDPRLQLHIQDGRNFLKTTRQRFDVVSADPIHPWNQGSGYLFTTDYYQTVKTRLTERGVMCQWLPTYSLSIENFKSAVATFASVFPHAMLWQNGRDTVLIGSTQAFRFDVGRLAERMREPGIAEQLALIGITDAHELLAEIALDSEAIREYAAGGIINTDDNLYLEFASPLSIGTSEEQENADLLNDYREGPWRDPDFLVASQADREQVESDRRAKLEILRITSDARTPLAAQIKRLRATRARHPDSGPARLALANLLGKRGLQELKKANPRLAARFLEEAVELQPLNHDAQRWFGAALLQLERFEQAIVHLQRSAELRPRRWRVHSLLSQALLGAGRLPEAIESLQIAVAVNPNNRDLAERLERLMQQG